MKCRHCGQDRELNLQHQYPAECVRLLRGKVGRYERYLTMIVRGEEEAPVGMATPPATLARKALEGGVSRGAS